MLQLLLCAGLSMWPIAACALHCTAHQLPPLPPVGRSSTADISVLITRAKRRRWLDGAQAKVGELEETVESLNARISQLATEKAALDSRVGILTRVLRMREEHIETLQRKDASRVPPPSRPPHAHTNTHLHTPVHADPQSPANPPASTPSACRVQCRTLSAWPCNTSLKWP